METVKRLVNVKDFGWFLKKDDSGKTVWDFPKDFICDEETFCNILPCVTYKEHKVLRWRTYVHYRWWLLKFISESDFLQLKKRNDNFFLGDIKKDGAELQELIEIFGECSGVYASDSEFFEENQEDLEGICGEKVCVSEDADIFIEMFRNIATAMGFLLFCDRAASAQISTPFIEIPFCATETVKDAGAVFTDCNEIKEGAGANDGSYTAYTQSRLNTLRRSGTWCDDEGITYDFVYNRADKRAEIPYAVGAPKNIIYENGDYKYNVLNKITYFNEEGRIVSGCTDKNYVTEDTPSNGVIQFEYEVGCCQEESGGAETIICQERHSYVMSALTIDGEEKKYLIISGRSMENTAAEDNVSYAKVTVSNLGDGTSEDCDRCIRNEAFTGIHDIRKDYEDIYIDRGRAAAYEAFNVLSEMNTIDEIEKYRDDWFRIKGKND